MVHNIIHSTYGPSQYQNVSKHTFPDGFVQWGITIRGVTRKLFDTEHKAAVAVDKYLISKGKEPVNVLKRKTA